MRFAPDAVDRQSDGVSAFRNEIVNDSELRDELQSLGADELTTVCDGWRNLDAEEEILDINGTPLGGSLIDFGDVYVVSYTSARDAAEAADDLAELSSVEYAEPNAFVSATTCSCATGATSIGDEEFPSSASEPGQWALSNPGTYSDSVATAVEDIDINLPEAWEIHHKATKKVGVIDLGFNTDHPDMYGVFDLANDACFGEGCTIGGTNSDHGNGSASVIGALANNGSTECEDDSTCTGVAGILGHPDSDGSLVVPITLEGVPQTVAANLADAVCYAADSLGLPVVNLSVTVPAAGDHLVRDAMRNAYQLGVLLVVGGGNTSTEGTTPPQNFDRFGFGVGALGIEGQHHSDFATGRHIDVVAPASASGPGRFGVGSMAADTNDYWRYHDTSAAAPHVAGSAALVLSYVPTLTNDDLIEVLSRRARDIDHNDELPSGYDEVFGFGLVRVDSTLCWLTENDLGHGFYQGYDDSSSTAGVRTFKGLPNTWGPPYYGGATDYFARVYRLKKYVAFDDYSGLGALPEQNVWVRSRQCTGWRDTLYVNVGEDLNWAGVDTGTVTADGCTLSTYFYKIYDDTTGTTLKQWFPFNPFVTSVNSVDWHFTYLYPCEEAGRHAAHVGSAESGDEAFVARKIGNTSLRVTLTTPADVELKVFDVGGRLVAIRRLDTLSPGAHDIAWDRRDRGGRRVAPGVYFVQLTDGVSLRQFRFVLAR